MLHNMVYIEVLMFSLLNLFQRWPINQAKRGNKHQKRKFNVSFFLTILEINIKYIFHFVAEASSTFYKKRKE